MTTALELARSQRQRYMETVFISQKPGLLKR